MKTKTTPLIIIVIMLISACQPAPTTLPIEKNTQTNNTISSPEIAEASTETIPEIAIDEPAEERVETDVPFEPRINLEIIAGGLTAPLDLDAPDDGSGRLFVTDQVGLIRIIDSSDNLLEKPLLDLRARMVQLNERYDERGLLGVALHPDFADNGRFYVYYSAPLRSEGPAGWDHTSILSEFTLTTSDPNIADPNSEKVILQIDQPQSNHNSGAIAFGPDGYLYIPLGDGGAAHDVGVGHAEDWYAVNPGGNGQNVEDTILGSILRIDVDKGDPYAIPENNPEISQTYPEIWAFGFRNPYRMAFDQGGTHELFLGDAGQSLWEEVSIVEAGGNYGWNVREGTHCFSVANPRTPDAIIDCPGEDPAGRPLIDPIIEFPNASHPAGGLGTSIVGGVVYRGERLPAWDGRYVFGQWSRSFASPQGGLFVAIRPEQGMWDFEAIEFASRGGADLNEYLLAIGQDMQGEIYALTSLSTGPSGNTGKVYRLLPPDD